MWGLFGSCSFLCSCWGFLKGGWDGVGGGEGGSGEGGHGRREAEHVFMSPVKLRPGQPSRSSTSSQNSIRLEKQLSSSKDPLAWGSLLTAIEVFDTKRALSLSSLVTSGKAEHIVGVVISLSELRLTFLGKGPLGEANETLDSPPQTNACWLCLNGQGFRALSHAPCSPILPSQATDPRLRNSITKLFREFSPAVTAWDNHGLTGLVCPFPLDSVFLKPGAGWSACPEGNAWALQSTALRDHQCNNQNPIKTSSELLNGSRLFPAHTLKITPFWWGSLDLLRPVLHSNLKISAVRIKLLKVLRGRTFKAETHWFSNKRERGNVQQQQEEAVLNPPFVKASQWNQTQTHTCIRSLSVWGCSCLTWGVTIAGWGMPVVWGPGGPGIIWWENLKKERKENVCTNGRVAKGGRILKQSTNCYWLKVKTHFYTQKY